MSNETTEQVADYSQEPKWLEISWHYANLEKATRRLSEDIQRYRNALAELDAAGTSIMNGKDRISILREDIAQMEAAK